ncbi:MAG: tRNA (N6-threonylcarbamoyladenosine(37)-N6)-methyltransferase TrmO [Ruminococcaceae bacterium]|nr:tRNA (N6-threonylcarbamoyladenosine(37)-N6)-methyltransferase TrmO [Oscillospiraceae bacterium]
MFQVYKMKIIAHIKTDFKEKFGIPRQSGLIPETMGVIIFEKEYRVAEAVRGLEEFSHIWLLWEFSKSRREGWSPTVRPPLLGGNKRMGVFATRSPFRPNPIGLSCVKLEQVRYSKADGPILLVSGADILDGTPIYDIKPYLPYADSHPEATGGFTECLPQRKLDIKIECEGFFDLPKNRQKEIADILSFNPTPSYKEDGKIYGMKYSDYEIKFKIEGKILYITEINSLIDM